MKTIHIAEDVHVKLRLRSIHSKKTLQEVANEILSQHLFTQGA